MLEDSALQEKGKLHGKEELLIAAIAARTVKEGEVVILDSGTITAAVASALRNLQNMTIITNAINIAVELSRFNLDVILTGGNLRKNSFSLWTDGRRQLATVERRRVLPRGGWFPC